jgi:hypothetical protein
MKYTIFYFCRFLGSNHLEFDNFLRFFGRKKFLFSAKFFFCAKFSPNFGTLEKRPQIIKNQSQTLKIFVNFSNFRKTPNFPRFSRGGFLGVYTCILTVNLVKIDQKTPDFPTLLSPGENVPGEIRTSGFSPVFSSVYTWKLTFWQLFLKIPKTPENTSVHSSCFSGVCTCSLMLILCIFVEIFDKFHEVCKKWQIRRKPGFSGKLSNSSRKHRIFRGFFRKILQFFLKILKNFEKNWKTPENRTLIFSWKYQIPGGFTRNFRENSGEISRFFPGKIGCLHLFFDNSGVKCWQNFNILQIFRKTFTKFWKTREKQV